MPLNLGQIRQMVLDAQGQDEMARALAQDEMARAVWEIKLPLVEATALQEPAFRRVGRFKGIGGTILVDNQLVDVLLSENLDEKTARRKGFVVGSLLQSHEFLRAIVERQQKGETLSEADKRALVLYQAGIRDDGGVLCRQASGFISCESDANSSREKALGGTFFVKASEDLDS